MTLSKPVLLIVVLTIAGGVFGYYSGRNNLNPYRNDPTDPSITGAERKNHKAWRPSPAWLPAYLVAVVPHRTAHPRNPLNLPGIPESVDLVGYGMENRDGLGYAFPSAMGRTKYNLASAGVGAGLGLIVAVAVCLAAGWVTVRKERDPDKA